MPEDTSLLVKLKRLGAWAVPTSAAPIRQAQLNQFFYPERDILPEQTLRPSSLTKFLDQKFRSLKDYLPDTIKLAPYLSEMTLEDLDLPMKINQHDVTTKDNKGYLFPQSNIPLSNKLGLGNSTFSIGKDEKGYYLSIFDSWDFDKEGDPLSYWYMKDMGKPYNLYDRVYFKPTARGKIPKEITRDIELPKEEE